MSGMLLLACCGFAKERHGQHFTEAEIGAFRILVIASRTDATCTSGTPVVAAPRR